MSNYTPESPAPTPVPCGGQPWRVINDTIECLTTLPPTGVDPTLGMVVVVATAIVFVGIVLTLVALLNRKAG